MSTIMYNNLRSYKHNVKNIYKSYKNNIKLYTGPYVPTWVHMGPQGWPEVKKATWEM